MRTRAGLWGAALAGLFAAAPVGAEGITASDALRDILAGNETFQKNETLARRRTAVAQGQSPQAIILSCSDSRVPPEAVFNRYVGRLFVIRTAGHAIGDFEYASIEYAVDHLHVPLLVVLGHERCGAIKATVEAVQGGGAAHEAPAGGARPAADEDADHPHAKSHRADRSPTDDEAGQRAGACAPKKKGHAAEEAGDDEDPDAAAPPAKKKSKAAKAGKKKLKHKAAPRDGEDSAAEDEDEDEDEEDAVPRKRKAKAPQVEEDDDEDDREPSHEAHGAPAHAVESAPVQARGAAEHISALVADLETPVREALKGQPADPVDAAVRVNTKWVVKRLVEESGVIREATNAGKLRIVGARYDLDTGAVELLE